MKNILFAFLFISPLFFLNACGQDGNYQSNNMNYSSNPSSVEFASFTDAREQAFTVSLPKGWKTQVSMERPYEQIRSCGVSVSPDGNSKLFFGDPTLPTFMLPNPQYGMYQGANTGNPLMQIQPYTNATHYFPNYVKSRYGQLPGFRLTGTSPNPTYQQMVEKKAKEYGFQAQISTVNVTFVYQNNGEEVQGKINGAIIGIQNIWLPDVNGFTTTGDANGMDKLLMKMNESLKTSPQWQQKENMRNQQKMAQSQVNHQARMQQRQAAFNAHQQRMQQRYAAADAQNQQWRQNQAIQDKSHQQFIDYIRDENTVTNSSGTQTGKVQAGHNNYYVNPNTGEYIGTNSYTNPDPTIYQHWIIK